MTLEIALYMLGVAVTNAGALIGAWYKLNRKIDTIEAKAIEMVEHMEFQGGQINSTHTMTGKLLEMHEHPENTGFGTVGIKEVIDANTRALKSLTYYIKWLAEKDGINVPPFIEDE